MNLLKSRKDKALERNLWKQKGSARGRKGRRRRLWGRRRRRWGEIKWTASEARGSPAEEGGGVGVSVEQVTTIQDPRTCFSVKVNLNHNWSQIL